MPVILNLIKESLKPVTLGAVGGHAIARVLLFLALFLSFCPSLQPNWCPISHTKSSERKSASAVDFYICPCLFESKENKSAPIEGKDIIAFIMLTRHVHLWELREAEYHYNTVNSLKCKC